MAKPPKQSLTQEIASARNDPKWWGSYLGLLENPDKVLRLEAQGDLEVYDDVGRDPHVASVLRTRALAVIGKEWEVVPGGDDARAAAIAEYVKQVFLGFPFDAARRALLRGGILRGFAVGEVLWDVSEGQYAIRGMPARPQRRFRFDLDGGLRLLTRAAPFAGELVCEAGGTTGPHPRKFQVFTFGDEPETPYGVGLGRELYWPAWFKKNGIKGWVVFCERFGQPTPWGKYPQGTAKADQDTLFDALTAMQEDNVVMTPEGMSIELLEAARTSSVDSYDGLCRFMNDEISKSVLGQTSTVSGTPGKLGSEDAQENVRLDLVDADADALSEALNAGVVRWVVDLNFGPQRAYPQIWIQTAPKEDLRFQAYRDKTLASLAPIGTAYIYDAYGIPKPAPGDELVWSPVNLPPGAGGGEEAAFAEGPTAAGRTGRAGQAALDGLLDLLPDAALQDQAEALLKPLLTRLSAGAPAEELLAELAAAYPDMHTDALEETLARLIFVAELFGRAEAAAEGPGARGWGRG